MSWLLALLLSASAHDLRPGAVSLREVAPATWAVRITPAQDGTGLPARFEPVWPGDCAFEQGVLRCPDLTGTLRIPGLDCRRLKVAVHVSWLDGASFDTVLMEGEDRTEILRTPSTPWPYLRLGVLHILGGLDHLLFVAGLTLVAQSTRSILGAVTAFTVAHSLTLAAAAIGWVSAPTAATELVIAASVLLLAREAAVEGETWTQRRPWVVAFGFGLVHGFGFAGVLTELGLPAGGVAWSLLLFNAGVELGQLMALLVWVGLAWGLTRWLGPASFRRLAAYGIGLPAGVWVVGRAVAWWGSLG